MSSDLFRLEETGQIQSRAVLYTKVGYSVLRAEGSIIYVKVSKTVFVKSHIAFWTS